MMRLNKRVVSVFLAVFMIAGMLGLTACSKNENEVMIYLYDEKTASFMTREMELEEVSLNSLIAAVAERLGCEIPLEYTTVEDSAATISFVEGTGPLSMGSTGEEAILASICKTVTENLEIEEVYYRVGDAAYSGHMDFGLDEPYPLD